MISTSPKSNSIKDAISIDQARWIAELNVMMTLGDGLYVSVLESVEIGGNAFWRAEVVNSVTGRLAGELHIDLCTGQNVTWHPCK